MNNWRLLLLAIVAVFQPIASFTDRNLIDGRQQCCDRLSSAPLPDTRSSLHGTYRLGKTTSALRRLNDRDEIHEDRRYELIRQRDPVFSRPSTERPLVENRERDGRQDPAVIARSSRIEYRLEKAANSQSRGRLLDVYQRERTTQHIRDLKPQDLTRRVVDRASRDVLDGRNDRIYTESSRDDYRTERFSDGRLSKNLFDSQREVQREQFRSGERRIALNRDTRRVSRTRDDVGSIEPSNNMNYRQRIARERLSVVRRETSIRADTRRYNDQNYEPRDLHRISGHRRSLLVNTRSADRIRDMRIRLNAREENRENGQRISANQRLSTDSFDERREQRDDRRQSRQQNKENTDRRASGERMQMSRRITRESRIMNEMNTQNEKNMDDRREIRHNERLSEIQNEIRDNLDSRRSHERIQMDRRNIRESIIMYTRNKRDVDGRREIRHTERMSKEARDEIRENLEQRLSRERILMERRDTRESRNMNSLNERDLDNRHNERISPSTRAARDSHMNRLSVERTQINRRNIREFRVMYNLVARDDRRVDSKRETNDRMTRGTRDENRVNPDHRLSVERIQLEKRNIREFRTVNTPNNKDVDSQREIRYNEERSTAIRKEIRQNPEQRISRERIQMDRRNIRDYRKIDNVGIRNARDVESRREIRNDAKLYTENRENPDHRLSRERIQLDRQNTRVSRIMNTLLERDIDSRWEIRSNEWLFRETRESMRENPDRRIARESRQVDRQINIRESRIIATRNERGVDSDMGNRREVKYNDIVSRQIRGDHITRERRVGSRSTDRVIAQEIDNSMMDRRARSTDRRSFRDIRAEPRLSRSADAERRSKVFGNRVEHSHKIENRERETIDARSRNVELSRNRERISSAMVDKTEIENDFSIANWQYVLYTMQAAYLCALFMQMLKPSHTEKSKNMSLRWLPISSHYNPIKVD